MDDRLRSESVFDPSLASLKSYSKLLGEKRSSMELRGESESTSKRIKTQDLVSVLHSGGIQTHNSESINKEAKDQFHLGKREESSKITEEPATLISDAFQALATGRNKIAILGDATCLGLGHIDPCPSPNLNIKENATKTACNITSARVADKSKPSLPTIKDKDRDLSSVTSRGTGLDLNIDVPNSAYQDPFYPYKIHGCSKSREASECGSSTGPMEENDSLRLWKEMKRNGFLSSLHGGIPIPKQHGKKGKNDALNKKMELAKREQVNRFTKITAPSGLLSGLNPGIINHVRNRKQVHAIIEALVRSEKLENGILNRSASQLKGVTEEMKDRRKDPEDIHDSVDNRFCHSREDKPLNTIAGSTKLSSSRPTIPLTSELKGGGGDPDIAERRSGAESSDASHFTSDHEDDLLTLKLSSSISMASESMAPVYNEESANQTSDSSLSVKAATVASQWLELLYQDITGRLAALRRSKKRVQAVIQTELPLLMSREFSSNQEDDPYFRQSSAVGCPDTATPNMHRERWTALFDQMDKSLSEEGKHLENWLNQVKEMQSHCEWGLQFFNWHGLRLSGSENDSRLKKAENPEKDLAVRAAAASIYSTCNFVMSTENLSCF